MDLISAFRFSPAAVLRFSGEDHAAFLQSQGTADLAMPVGACSYSLWLDYKGRIEGDGFVLRESADAMLLISYASPAAALVEKFQRHIIADDVAIADLTAAHDLVAIAPDDSAAWAAASGLPLPGAGGILRQADALLFYGRRLGRGTLDLLVAKIWTPPVPLRWMQSCEADAQRIADGIPMVPDDTAAEALNPVEAGLVQAVSFTKGCYLGQEVVARVQRLQRASRRLVRLTGLPRAPELPCPLQQAGVTVGTITSQAAAASGVLAIATLKSRVPDGIQVFDAGEITVATLAPA